jgi:hypothetical protein
MNAVQSTLPMPADSTPSADIPPPEERKSWRNVSCSRCRQPLFFPASHSSRNRTPFLFCRKCGARTAIPTLRRRLFQITAILIFLAACVFVVLTFIKEN